jgi:hypothetical protein
MEAELAIFRLTKQCVDPESTNATIGVEGGIAGEESGTRRAWRSVKVLALK